MPFNTGTIVKSQLAKPCVGTEELLDGCITNNKLTSDCVITENIANASISQPKLKTWMGTWSINVPANTHGTVYLTDYSFFPRQRVQHEYHLLWHVNWGNFPTEQYVIFTFNGYSQASTWTGSYRYILASEQIVEVYRDILTNKVIGVHVTERINEHSVRLFDKNRIEISVKREVYNYLNTPNLFDQKLCILSATKIMNNLMEEKAIDERN